MGIEGSDESTDYDFLCKCVNYLKNLQPWCHVVGSVWHWKLGSRSIYNHTWGNWNLSTVLRWNFVSFALISFMLKFCIFWIERFYVEILFLLHWSVLCWSFVSFELNVFTLKLVSFTLKFCFFLSLNWTFSHWNFVSFVLVSFTLKFCFFLSFNWTFSYWNFVSFVLVSFTLKFCFFWSECFYVEILFLLHCSVFIWNFVCFAW